MSETIRAVTTVTVETDAVCPPTTKTFSEVMLAGLWFSADAMCERRPLVLVPQPLVDQLVNRAHWQGHTDSRLHELTDISAAIYKLRRELQKLSGVQV